MKTYRATIQADRYPLVVTVGGSSWSVAAARATRLWQARFKGSRAARISITIVKVDGEL